MGKQRRRATQASMWVATQDLPRSAAHPFYRRLNQILERAAFDAYVRAALSTVLRRRGRSSRPGAGSLFPHAAARVLRRARLRAGDRVAGGRFVERAELSGARAARGAAGSFDGLAHAPSDRHRNASGGVHVGVAATRCGESRQGEDDRDRRDDAGSQRGVAQYRAAWTPERVTRSS